MGTRLQGKPTPPKTWQAQWAPCLLPSSDPGRGTFHLTQPLLSKPDASHRTASTRVSTRRSFQESPISLYCKPTKLHFKHGGWAGEAWRHTTTPVPPLPSPPSPPTPPSPRSRPFSTNAAPLVPSVSPPVAKAALHAPTSPHPQQQHSQASCQQNLQKMLGPHRV